MEVHFRSNYPSRFWIAILAYDPENCGGEGGDWIAAGWWTVAKGENVYAFETDNRYFAYYAEAEDGRIVSGDLPVYVIDDRFYICYRPVSSASYPVAMVRVDGGADADVCVVQLD